MCQSVHDDSESLVSIVAVWRPEDMYQHHVHIKR